MTTGKIEQSHPYMTVIKTLVAGGIAGCCAKTSVAPLDRVKILLQAHNQHYKHLGVMLSLRSVKQKEGLSGLFKGNGVHMVRVFPYAAIQFASYEQYKKLMKKFFHHKHPHLTKLITGSMAGLTAVLCTYPLDIVRARLAFQVKGEHIMYRGLHHTFMVIVHTEGGLKALYRGMVPTLLGMTPYAGLAFYSFETLKSVLLENFSMLFSRPSPSHADGQVLSIPGKVLCGGVAGAVAQTMTYPLDVVRRRVQLANMLPDSHKYNKSWYKILYGIYREDGIVCGMYRGMSINFIRVVPMVSVSFSVYELCKQCLGLDTEVDS